MVYPDTFGDGAEIEVGASYSVLMVSCRNYQASKLEYTYRILLKIFGDECRLVRLVMAGLKPKWQ